MNPSRIEPNLLVDMVAWIEDARANPWDFENAKAASGRFQGAVQALRRLGLLSDQEHRDLMWWAKEGGFTHVEVPPVWQWNVTQWQASRDAARQFQPGGGG